MTTTLTLTPTSVITDQAVFVNTGGAGSKHAALADASDATYLGNGAQINLTMILDMGNPTIPAGAIVESIALRIRALSNNANTFIQADQITTVRKGQTSPLRVRGGITESYLLDNVVHDATSAAYDRCSDGTLFDDCDLSVLWVSLRDYAIGTPGGGQNIYKLEALVNYNSAPTVTFGTIPTNTSLPTIPWTYADTDSDPQTAYRLMVFAETAFSYVYGPGGSIIGTATAGTAAFVPENCPAAQGLVYDSGKVLSSLGSKKITTGLTNASKYWFYIKVWQANVVGKEMASTWTASALTTIAVTPPTAPTATVTAAPSTASVLLDVQEANTATPHPAYYDVERSIDNGLSWVPVRFAKQTAASIGYRFLGTAANTLTSANTWNAAMPPSALCFIDIRASLPDWSPASSTGWRTLAHYGTSTGNDRGIIIGVTPTGALRVQAATVGTGYSIDATSTVAIPVADGDTTWLRVVLVPFLSKVQFFTSPDGVTWTQFGADVAIGSTSMRTPTTVGWKIGQSEADANTQLTGRVSRLRFTTVLGNVSLDLDLTGKAAGTTSVTDPYGQVFTVNTTGAAGSYWQMGLTVSDHELTPGVPAKYRARSWRDDSEQSTGAWVTTVSPVTITPVRYWLKDPLFPALNARLNCEQLDRDRPNPQQVSYGMDDPLATVSAAKLRGSSIAAKVRTTSKTEYDQLQALLSSGRILLLQSTMLEQWYVKVGSNVRYRPVRSQAAAGEITPTRHHYTVDLDLVETGVPL